VAPHAQQALHALEEARVRQFVPLDPTARLVLLHALLALLLRAVTAQLARPVLVAPHAQQALHALEEARISQRVPLDISARLVLLHALLGGHARPLNAKMSTPLPAPPLMSIASLRR